MILAGRITCVYFTVDKAALAFTFSKRFLLSSFSLLLFLYSILGLANQIHAYLTYTIYDFLNLLFNYMSLVRTHRDTILSP